MGDGVGQRKILYFQISKAGQNPPRAGVRACEGGRQVLLRARGQRCEPRLSVKVQFREKEFFKIPHGMTANEVERETVKRPAERIGAAVEKPAERVDSVPGTAACVAVAAAAPALQRLSPLHQTDAKCSVTWSPAFVACCGNVLLSQGVTSRRKLGSDGQRHQISTRDIEKVKTNR